MAPFGPSIATAFPHTDDTAALGSTNISALVYIAFAHGDADTPSADVTPILASHD